MKKMNQTLGAMLILFLIFGLLILSGSADEVDPMISITTDKESYMLGEQINISGTLTMNTSVIVEISIEQGEFKRFQTIQAENNQFTFSYPISYGDPEGDWIINASIPTDNGSLTTTTQVKVTFPDDIVRYHLIWFSPVPEASYQRGSQINLSVYVTEDQHGVTNASVRCILPSMKEIILSEIKQGYYHQNYTIPWNSTLEKWMLSSECQKTVNDITYAGGNQIEFSLKPATLDLILQYPLSDSYSVDDSFQIDLQVLYPDGSPAEECMVSLTIFNKTFSLISVDEGVYQLDDSVFLTQIGSSVFTIVATDPYGNQGTIQQVLTVTSYKSGDGSLLVLSGIMILLGGIIVFLFFFRTRVYHLLTQDADMEIKEIKSLQKEAAEKYYISGAISRDVYDSLRKSYTQRIEELRYQGPLKKNTVSKMVHYFKQKR